MARTSLGFQSRDREAEVRIVHVGPAPTRPGGMAAVVRDLLASPLADAYSLDVIATYTTRSPLRRMLVFARALLVLARWCAGPGRRLVHVHAAVRGSLYRKSLCVAVAKLLRRPIVFQVHAGSGDIDEFVARIGPVRRALFGAAVRSTDRVLSVSHEGALRIEALFGVREVLVVPNAAPPVRSVERDPGEANADARVLYLGGFSDPAKGGLTLVAALPSIIDACPSAWLTLAGPGEPPAALLDLTAETDRVRWMGWLDEPERDAALECCDVFVLPSLSEGLPVALLEAMALGRAILASAVGGIPDVLTDGADAVLVPPADAEALARELAALVGSPAERSRLGGMARERAERLNRDEVFGRIDRIYAGLLA